MEQTKGISVGRQAPGTHGHGESRVGQLVPGEGGEGASIKPPDLGSGATAKELPDNPATSPSNIKVEPPNPATNEGIGEKAVARQMYYIHNTEPACRKNKN